MSSIQKWSGLTVLTVVAILVGSWFLLVAPKRGEAADLSAQAATQQQANQRLVQKLEVLKAQAAELPSEKAKLRVVRQQIPEDSALPTLIRSLTGAGQKTGVTLVSLAPGTAAPVAAAGAPVTAGTTAATLYQVPLTVKVAGSYFELEQYVNELEQLKRALLVSGFTLDAPDTDASTTSGTGADGDLQLSINGRVFVAPPIAAAAAATTATGAAASTTTTTAQ